MAAVCLFRSIVLVVALSVFFFKVSSAQNEADCDACVAATKTWCVITNVKGVSVRQICLSVKVNDIDLDKGHKNCLNGKLYNVCKAAQDLNQHNMLPPANELDCTQCTAKGMKWCKASATDQKCVGDNAINCPTPLIASNNCASAGPFSFDNPPRTCGACIIKETTGQIFCKGIDVEYSRCSTASAASTDCPSAEHLSSCGSNSGAVINPPHQYGMSCSVCLAYGKKWCLSEPSTSQKYTLRFCLDATKVADCVDGQIIDDCSKIPFNHRFTHVPRVGEGLPGSCEHCQKLTDARWCATEDAHLCLPTKRFPIFCSVPRADGCDPKTKNKLLPSLPIFLPSTCSECVKNTGIWCLKTIGSDIYRLCVPNSGFDGLCDKTMIDCLDVKAHERKAVIPAQPKTCDQCVLKKDHGWCVSSFLGEKVRVCLDSTVGALLCSTGVFTHHCSIAAEDRIEYLGVLGKLLSSAAGPVFLNVSYLMLSTAVFVVFQFI